MIKRLDHPLLPRIVDIIDKPEAIYIVMDYIEGEALSKVLDRQGAQPQNEVIGWAIDLCKVLDYLHTQNPPIIYRDMKPANIMLLPNGSVKLIDFGIAREYKNENMADTVSLGTRGYAAPEQFGGKGQTDVRTDIYSLGVTLYHLLTGHSPSEPPYEVYPIRHWNPRLSSGLESIILKCTQANPQDRYQSCVELLYALEHYGEMDESYRSAQRQKLNKFIASAAAAAFCLVIGSSCFALHNYMNKNDYDSNIRRAEMSSTSKERIEYYTKAMDIKPANTKAYFGIIEAFKDELRLLGGSPVIVALGGASYNLITENLKGNYRICKIKHYSYTISTTLFISEQNESGRKITSSASFYAELSGASVFLPGRSDHIRGSDRSGSVCL